MNWRATWPCASTETDVASDFLVSGRGELHLAILIETMRREGYEFSVSKPEVILHESAAGSDGAGGAVFIEVHNDYLGAVSEMMGKTSRPAADMSLRR